MTVMIVIGASTGGPQALEPLLASLPENFPSAILVAQHIPRDELFLRRLLERLKQSCSMPIKCVEDNEMVQSGIIYIAPSGFQVLTEKRFGEIVFRLNKDQSLDNSPCIDDSMISVARTYQENAIGIILTGMGKDGLEGMRTIKNYGGRTIAQDETAFLFGMPKAVIENDLADKILPVETIPDAISELLAISKK